MPEALCPEIPDTESPTTLQPMRQGRELNEATKPFAKEHRGKSWWYTISTLVIIAVLMTTAALGGWWPLRAVAAVLAGLVFVRGFILYHDFMHGAILKNSKIANAIMYIYGLCILAPPSSWRRSHNFHHAHTAKIENSHIGSFPVMTVEMWKEASFGKRLSYRMARHPLTIACSYITVFFAHITLASLISNPRRHKDCAFALLLHGGAIAALWLIGGFWMAFFTIILPYFVAAMLGGYLFYAQHNFDDVHVLEEEEWTYNRAALESSSYLKLNPIMRWFTGNIGYHHVHHLNLSIPFYRLPEAMAAIPELQNPPTTTLSIRDIVVNFKQCLWDEASHRMVSFREARAMA